MIKRTKFFGLATPMLELHCKRQGQYARSGLPKGVISLLDTKHAKHINFKGLYCPHFTTFCKYFKRVMGRASKGEPKRKILNGIRPHKSFTINFNRLINMKKLGKIIKTGKILQVPFPNHIFGLCKIGDVTS